MLFWVADGVMSVEWSSSSEWVLVTGGCDGAIRFWDIRRAGCFRVLDQSQSQLGRRPPILERTATNKVSILLCFFLISEIIFLVLCFTCFYLTSPNFIISFLSYINLHRMLVGLSTRDVSNRKSQFIKLLHFVFSWYFFPCFRQGFYVQVIIRKPRVVCKIPSRTEETV